MTDLIWDWNGTLLDDTHAAVEAMNVLLVRRGLKPITLEYYRANFGFPVERFYRQLGVTDSGPAWDALAVEYHAAYATGRRALAAGALSALALTREAGVRNHLVSVSRTDLLRQALAEYDLGGWFDTVLGGDSLDGAGKGRVIALFVDRLLARGVGLSDLAMIGDSLHDAECAAAAGIECVLYAGGSHAGERLGAVAPVEATLEDCVRRLLGRGGGRMGKGLVEEKR